SGIVVAGLDREDAVRWEANLGSAIALAGSDIVAVANSDQIVSLAWTQSTGELDRAVTASGLGDSYASVLSIAAQADGKILVSAYDEAIGDIAVPLVRLNSDGTADTDFNANV